LVIMPLRTEDEPKKPGRRRWLWLALPLAVPVLALAVLVGLQVTVRPRSAARVRLGASDYLIATAGAAETRSGPLPHGLSWRRSGPAGDFVMLRLGDYGWAFGRMPHY
jgi:hypothetical protein